MVRVCAYPGCFNQMKRWCLRRSRSVTFHKLPVQDPERLEALGKDIGTANVDSLRVCRRPALKTTAVPTVLQDVQAQMTEECLEEGLDVSMASIVPLQPKDTSFKMPRSTSTPASEEKEDVGTWDERKRLVNESKLFQLFKTGHQCGSEIDKTNVHKSGSQIRIFWECMNQHQGEWSSQIAVCVKRKGKPRPAALDRIHLQSFVVRLFDLWR
uniref:THAP-type domain-containing protein n=1 Tax=Salarias fasciatus TaxID=181472 RepID=A0A672IF66_SALFA